jgi:hypothetical protein
MAEINDAPRRWKVVGHRAYYWGKKIMKPGQIFVAFEKDLPAELKSIVIALDGIPDTPPVIPKIEAPKITETVIPVTYHIKERFLGGTFDIINSRGKRINEKALTKEEADKMLNFLQI